MRYLWMRRFPSKDGDVEIALALTARAGSFSNAFRVELLLNEMIEYKTP
jgi:hypothetical protein